MTSAAGAGAPASAARSETDLTPTPGVDSAGVVLVLRALGLGDALTGIPALRGIRRAWPDRRLVLAASAPVGRWLRSLGIVDEVLVTDGLAPLQWPPSGWIGAGGHIAVNLHGSGPQSHRVLEATAPSRLVAYRCSLATQQSGSEWRHDEHEVDRWCRLIIQAGGRCDATDLRLRLPGLADRGDTVVLHPGAASASRRWPSDRWAWLAAQLAARGLPVVISGGPTEVALCRDIAEAATTVAGRDDLRGPAAPIRILAGRTDLAGLAEFVGTAGLLVCGDTGVAHLATALSTPSVMLFGPTPPRWWGPRIDPRHHRVLWHGENGYLGNPHGDTIDPALAAITADEALEAVLHQLRMSGLGALPVTTMTKAHALNAG